MENILYYASLLACPLMLGVMFFMMRGMMGGNDKSNHQNDHQQQMKKNMNELLEQNKKLVQEMDDLKRSK